MVCTSAQLDQLSSLNLMLKDVGKRTSLCWMCDRINFIAVCIILCCWTLSNKCVNNPLFDLLSIGGWNPAMKIFYLLTKNVCCVMELLKKKILWAFCRYLRRLQPYTAINVSFCRLTPTATLLKKKWQHFHKHNIKWFIASRHRHRLYRFWLPLLEQFNEGVKKSLWWVHDRNT